MSGFDKTVVTSAGRGLFPNSVGVNVDDKFLHLAKSSFKEFLRSFNYGGFTHYYRELIRNRCSTGEYYVEIRMEDLIDFCEETAKLLHTKPIALMPALEAVAQEVATEITKLPAFDEMAITDMQVIFNSSANPKSIRLLRSEEISKLVKLRGIVVSTSQVRTKATKISLECRSCHHCVNDIHLQPGLDGYQLPRRCVSEHLGQLQNCPVDPYIILPDKCQCIDFQLVKLQECHEDVPHGELPRHMNLYLDRYLTDRVVPGNTVSLIGIYCVKKSVRKTASDRGSKPTVGIRVPYVRVLGVQIESSGVGRAAPQAPVSPEEEQAMRAIASQPDVYTRLVKSIAPSIFGSDDIKKAIACLLFGGSRKRLPDGLIRRGDINVLLLGDPGMAKSQLLKFVERVSPIGVYTSGKGSSAAGLTAAVVRDVSSRSFIMEGGAMVLADGGVVCIDEFDKMREDDRVAIHEAMEQQTISIAKAGITTTLNSRCAVLAAANSIYGRWDMSKGEDNIDFMPTILSRFDAIFVIRDTHSQSKDMEIAKHVISLHVNCSLVADNAPSAEGEIPMATLKKYIAYCRSHCGPRLSAPASRKLVQSYVRMRNVPVNEQSGDLHISYHKSTIPITLRQLEAVIRMSEALAKMELQPFALERHVDEALRLFQVSTLAAASQGSLTGAVGLSTAEDQETFVRIERQLKKRFPVGTQIPENVVVQDFVVQGYPEHCVHKVLYALMRKGDFHYRLQRKMLYRIK